MSKTKPSDPISPESVSASNYRSVASSNSGLTKREYFAAQALSGIMSILGKGMRLDASEQEITKRCVNLADALIKELNGEK